LPKKARRNRGREEPREKKNKIKDPEMGLAEARAKVWEVRVKPQGSRMVRKPTTKVLKGEGRKLLEIKLAIGDGKREPGRLRAGRPIRRRERVIMKTEKKMEEIEARVREN